LHFKSPKRVGKGRGRKLSSRLPLGRPLAALVLLSSLLAGCANDVMRPALEFTPKVDKLAPLTMPSSGIGMGSGDDVDSDIISTQSRQELIPTPLISSDPLPSYVVPKISFSGTPLQDVLQVVIRDSGVGLSVVWDTEASKISRSSASMNQLGGDLTSVLNTLADSFGFYWRFKDGMLHITADRQYITPVPPISDLFDSLPIMVKTLGGTDVFLDKSTRMITFRADSQSFSKIKSYLDITRKNRSLIIYDTYIWEVVLNDGSKMGVDWGSLKGPGTGTSLTAGPSSALPAATDLLTAGLVNGASSGTGLALSFAGSRFSMNLLIDFLRSQGTVNSLSQPKIQMLSGGKAALRDEIATTYVSRVSSSTVSAGTVIPGSVETSQIKTGITLEVSGDVSDGTIFSDIALRVSDLLAMDSATLNGNTITLPQTSSREVSTHVRVKPGDTILLAGIQYDRLSGAIKSGLGIVRSNQSDSRRSELIIVMRPRIKRFVSDGAPSAAAPVPAAEAPSAAAPPPAVAPLAVLPPAATQPFVEPPLPQPLPKPDPVAVVPSTSSATAAPAVRSLATQNGSTLSSDTKIPSGFYVQHGAFRQLSNAESMRQELHEQLGWNPNGVERVYLSPPTKPSKLYRVLVGPFDERKDAVLWAERGRRVLGTPLVLVTL
jgi:cell division septation protein DedD